MTNTMLAVKKEMVFVNPILTKHMSAIAKAESAGVKKAWEIAKHYVAIIDSECFKDDFDDVNAFCEYVGLSKGTISKYRKAVSYANEHSEVMALGYTIRRAYTMATLKDDEKADFMAWVSKTGRNISSDNLLQEAISDFRKKDAIEADAKTVKESDEDEAEPKKEVKAKTLTKAGGDKYVTFKYDGNEYEIPIKALAKYLKK